MDLTNLTIDRHEALIVVDIQNDFLPGGQLAVPDGDQVIPIVNQLIPQFPLVVATQDWHPANHLSFASNHADHDVGDLIDLSGTQQVLWPDHCIQDTAGAAFAAELDQSQFARIFTKGTRPEIDSYSGFFDNGRRHATGLADYLRESEIDTVTVVGLATDYCVKFTALDAAELGFRTRLVTAACRGVNLQANDVAQACDEMDRAGIELI